MTDGRHSARASSRDVVLLLGVLALLGPVSLPACVHTVTQAEESRSIAEQDLAVDAQAHGRIREALDHVQQALKFNPDNAEASRAAAGILLAFCALDERAADCRFKDAEAHARHALEVDPNLREARNILGVILVHEHRYDEAIAVLKPLADDLVYANPESAWGNLGWAYLERGSTDEAIEALRRSIAAQPLFCVGNYRLGLAYEQKGELALAREALTTALETDHPACKRLQDAFGARARVLERLGLKAEARSDLARCRDLAVQTQTGQKCAAQLATAPP
jgi:Tfp pilus assembly protein PilF